MVLLVHGILGNGIVYWNRMRKYFERDGIPVAEVPLPFLGFGDLRKSAVELSRIVERHAARSTGGRVDMVAHSAGGLAARYYVRFLGGHRKVRVLLTLGTPNRGTYLSALFPLATVSRQTLPGSEFLDELNAGSDAPKGVRVVSLYTRTDGIVWPHHSALLRDGENVRVRGLTHWGFLWAPQAYRAIRGVLDA